MEIVLIVLHVIQKYIIDCIENLILFGNLKITIIVDDHIYEDFVILLGPRPGVDINIAKTSHYDDVNFERLTKQQKGYWQSTSKRFFILNQYMKKHKKTNICHIENDIMVYGNFDELNKFQDKLLFPLKNEHQAIFSILIVPKQELLQKFIDTYIFDFHDMQNGGIFYQNNKDIIIPLPIIKLDENVKIRGTPQFLYENYEKVSNKYIFDAAEMGQYLGGDHTGNPYVDENSKIGYNTYKYNWKKHKEYVLPFIVSSDGTETPIFNLHIHSKRTKEFRSDNINLF